MNFVRTITLCAITCLAGCASHSVDENPRFFDPLYSDQAMDSTGVARVLSSTPIYSDARRRTQVAVCDNPNEVEHGLFGATIGAIFGGIVGSQFGSGDGRVAATAVGATSGAATGYVIGASQPAQTGCTTVSQMRLDDDISAYDVIYEYAGLSYRTRLTYKPGTTLKVNVAVTPMHP